jgi:hypothetical protein
VTVAEPRSAAEGLQRPFVELSLGTLAAGELAALFWLARRRRPIPESVPPEAWTIAETPEVEPAL